MKLQIVIGGKVYEVEYDTGEEDSAASSPAIERVQSIVLPTPLRPVTAGTTEGDESKLCRTPVAGIVARIRVEPGQSVHAGDILVVVEAMKMENNLAAAGPAKIKCARVKVGDPVKAGQVVVEFE